MDTKVPVQKVVITNPDKVSQDRWFDVMDEAFRSYDKSEFLPNMTTRKYIHARKGSKEVKIMGKKKGPITVGNILFASRAFMVDPFRVFEKFTLKSYAKDVLTLKVDINNFDT